MMADVFVLLDATDDGGLSARVFTTYHDAMNAIHNDAEEWEADFIVNEGGEDGPTVGLDDPCFGIDHEMNADGEYFTRFFGDLNHRCVHFVGDFEYAIIRVRVQ